jgi:hypothetical protein
LVGEPATAVAGPEVTDLPDEASTSIDESFGSGASVKVSTTSVGADERFEPALGCDDESRAWAMTGDARPMATTRPAPAANQRTRAPRECGFIGS